MAAQICLLLMASELLLLDIKDDSPEARWDSSLALLFKILSSFLSSFCLDAKEAKDQEKSMLSPHEKGLGSPADFSGHRSVFQMKNAPLLQEIATAIASQ